MLFEFGFKTLKQGERIRCRACETCEHLAVVQLAHFARAAFDDGVAQRDLTVATDGDLCAASH